MTPRISIIINTCNRADHLNGALAALHQQRDAVFEIIVVNGPSTDHTSTVLGKWGDRVKVATCPLHELSISRNIGMAQAAGELIAFIDDDARPADDYWLARYTKAFVEDTDQRIGAWGGPVINGHHRTAEFDRGEVSDYCFLQFHPNWPRPSRGRKWLKTVCGCNMVYRADALRAIGGFDERFTYYAEETDVVRRLAHKGLSVCHLPDPAVMHFPQRARTSNPMLTRNWFINARSDTIFAMKHGCHPLPLRLVITVLHFRHKHYIQELCNARRNGELTHQQWLELRAQAIRGLRAGLHEGLFGRPALQTFSSTPPAFKPFHAV